MDILWPGEKWRQHLLDLAYASLLFFSLERLGSETVEVSWNCWPIRIGSGAEDDGFGLQRQLGVFFLLLLLLFVGSDAKHTGTWR